MGWWLLEPARSVSAVIFEDVFKSFGDIWIINFSPSDEKEKIIAHFVSSFALFEEFILASCFSGCLCHDGVSITDFRVSATLFFLFYYFFLGRRSGYK